MKILTAVVCAAITLTPAGAQQLSPRSTVESFASLDAAGARLESGPNDPIWKLTADDGESPVQPVVLIDSYKVSEQAGSGSTLTVPVKYAVKGVVKDNGGTVSFISGRRVIPATFTLIQGDDGTWKISEAKLPVSPHVTTAAYLQHLDKLLALYDPAKDAADPRYRSLLRLRKTLIVTGATK